MGTNNTDYPTISSIQAVAGDVCFINSITKDFVILSHNEWDMSRYSENLIPIGVIVIPGAHNVYGDGSCAIVDLDDTKFLVMDLLRKHRNVTKSVFELLEEF